MKHILLSFITVYQKIFSPDTGLFPKLGIARPFVCVFYPTCSEYCMEAIIKHGILKGLVLGVKRVIRCHPWQTPHIDSVP